MISNELVPKLTNKRVFYNPSSFLSFLQKNQSSIENVKVKPAKLGKKGFGVIEVKVKELIINEQKYATIK